jgi:hypothetical protein
MIVVFRRRIRWLASRILRFSTLRGNAMANRRLRIATSLTGLLVVANSGLLPGD